ncbi:hypothetical protein PF005_g19146 [Phytophthora fragariae]|uniref:Uncharacterized protein n=1 Tax=Phytophthora fragariae TaxID=53985 RepID=A0A6A3R720_9STRA|nr:hypothetical protein PF007_g19116 [Phytophthora fragariae]KAE9190704.1 hypothetical protein PF005_g19146 [Phytophthora fragariae]
MASVCVGWTSWLILLIVKPNETVNWVMKTGDFNNGSFWLMVDAPAVINWLAVCGYSLVWLLYSVVLVRTLRHKNRLAQLEYWASHRFVKVAAFLKTNRQYVRVWMKIVDLTVETLILFVVLEDGSPIGLVVTFTAIVTMNAFSCAVLMFLPDSYAGLTEVIVDITFDFLFAVAFPIFTVVCSLSSLAWSNAPKGIRARSHRNRKPGADGHHLHFVRFRQSAFYQNQVQI